MIYYVLNISNTRLKRSGLRRRSNAFHKNTHDSPERTNEFSQISIHFLQLVRGVNAPE